MKSKKGFNIKEHKLTETQMMDFLSNETLTPIYPNELNEISEDDLIEYLHSNIPIPKDKVDKVVELRSVYPDGNIRMHGESKNNKPFGVQFVHYHNGEVNISRDYNEDGQRHGFELSKYEDGVTTKSIKSYYKGMKEGVWSWFDKNGYTTKMVGYKNNKKCLPSQISFKKFKSLKKNINN